MPQLQIVSGIYSNAIGDYRQSYPINFYPVIMQNGLTNGYLRQTPGLVQVAAAYGPDRGSIEFNGLMYRVSGPYLVRVYSNGVVDQLAVIPGADRVTMVKSIDRICIVANRRGFYWTDSGGLVEITDPDFGYAIDAIAIDGYFLFVNDQYIFNSDLNNPLSFNPLSFASAEIEGDPIVGIEKVRNEAYICGTETIEIFQDVGGSGFPFQRIQGAMIPKGIAGTYAKTNAENSLFFIGAGHGEAPSVYLSGGGQVQKIATDEIEKIIQEYAPEELANVYCESYTANGQFFVLAHFSDKTLVYDLYESQEAGVALWHIRKRNDAGYRARGFVRVWNRWLCGDSDDGRIGELKDSIPTEYEDEPPREFTTPLAFVDGNSFIMHRAMLFGLPGRVELGGAPRISLSISRNGLTYSQDRWSSAGDRGDYNWVPTWRQIGRATSAMTLKFKLSNRSFFNPSYLSVDVEQLNATT